MKAEVTYMEVTSMFEDMVKGWFGGEGESAYNDFIKALLLNDVDAMNDFMNEIALVSFSNFDTAKSASLKDAPERFYHGFVLGLMVELDGRFKISSNRDIESLRYSTLPHSRYNGYADKLLNLPLYPPFSYIFSEDQATDIDNILFLHDTEQ